MSEREAEQNLTAKLEESGYREELKKKVCLLLQIGSWQFLMLVDCQTWGEWLEGSSEDDLQGCRKGERAGQDHCRRSGSGM